MKKALLIGNNDNIFESYKLNGTHNDVKLIDEVLSMYSFESTKKFDLNKDEIVFELKKLISSLKEKDIGVFFFSGHGKRLLEKYNSKNKIEGIIAKDFNPIMDVEIDDMLNELNPKSQLVLIYDTCHSEGMFQKRMFFLKNLKLFDFKKNPYEFLKSINNKKSYKFKNNIQLLEKLNLFIGESSNKKNEVFKIPSAYYKEAKNLSLDKNFKNNEITFVQFNDNKITIKEKEFEEIINVKKGDSEVVAFNHKQKKFIKKRKKIRNNVIKISACKKMEKAYEKKFNETFNGAFSYYFHKVLNKENNKNITYSKLMSEIKKEMKLDELSLIKEQTPCILMRDKKKQFLI